MNASEAAALNVISDVLRTSANRKHDMNVANAGRSEIVINTGENNQGTIYSDIQGNVYLLYNGIIYPISKDLVNQAKSESGESVPDYQPPTINNATLPNFNLSSLESEFKFEKEKTSLIENVWKKCYLKSNTEYLSSIASRFNVSINDIYFRPYKYNNGSPVYHPMKRTTLALKNIFNTSDSRRQKIDKYYYSKKPLTRTSIGCEPFPGLIFSFPGYKGMKKPDGYEIYIHIYNEKPKYSYKFEIISIFTCNWAKDFDGKGFGFDDFQGIKRSFNKDERLTFIMGYTSETRGTWKLEVFEMSTGKKVLNNTGIADSGGRVVWQEKGNIKLHPGVYVYNFTLTLANNENVSRSEKFEILEDPDLSKKTME